MRPSREADYLLLT